jgi:hypothetical protein
MLLIQFRHKIDSRSVRDAGMSLCQWRDGSSSWVPLVNLKDSNPVELAEYAVANRIHEEPAFKWWDAADVLR